MDYEFEWWHTHALVVFGLVGIIVGWITLFIVNDIEVLRYSTLALIGVFSLVFVLAMWPAFFGFYFDAKAVKRNGSGWSPHWWLYMLGTVLGGIFITAPIYLVQRHRHTGIP